MHFSQPSIQFADHEIVWNGLLIEGFETPYGMELLSSVHWVACHTDQPANDEVSAIAAVHVWNERKRTMFQPAQIAVAWRRLVVNSRLPVKRNLIDTFLHGVPLNGPAGSADRGPGRYDGVRGPGTKNETRRGPWTGDRDNTTVSGDREPSTKNGVRRRGKTAVRRPGRTTYATDDGRTIGRATRIRQQLAGPGAWPGTACHWGPTG